MIRVTLTELARLLGKHRLVTLTEIGGVGKTRLALQMATETMCVGCEIETFDVLDLKHALVRKSLMLTVRAEQAVRYRLLETIR